MRVSARTTDQLTARDIMVSIPTAAWIGTPKPLTAAFPEVAGLGFPLALGHVSDDVTTSTSKAQPSVLGADEPGYVAGALPLPRAGVAVARTAVQMAFALILKKPVPCCLLVCSAPRA